MLDKTSLCSYYILQIIAAKGKGNQTGVQQFQLTILA